MVGEVVIVLVVPVVILVIVVVIPEAIGIGRRTVARRQQRKTYNQTLVTTTAVTKKTQAMTCMPGNIRLQLPTKSDQQMCTGCTPADDWVVCTYTCRECRKDIQASSLRCHLADLHEIYQQQVMAKELLDRQEGVVYDIP
jgi:hypothetical protein